MTIAAMTSTREADKQQFSFQTRSECEVVETRGALSGIAWLGVKSLEHESEKMIPVIERNVRDQSA